MTPIYLLSMLRVVFYGQNNEKLELGKFNLDAKPREIFISACLILPIIIMGLYPKLATETFDAKIVEVNSKVRSVLPMAVQEAKLYYHQDNVAKQLPPAVFISTKIN